MPPWAALEQLLGPAIEDASEETFLLFSQQIPSQNLGFVDAKSTHLTTQVGGRDIEIRQSPGLLTSNRDAGTTGAVLWKITPLVANWLIQESGLLWNAEVLRADANVVELGCGISGLLGIALAPLVGSYLLTDQDYIMKMLQENVASNMVVAKAVGGKKNKAHGAKPRAGALHTLPFDWEADSAVNIQQMVGRDKSVDVVVACDCIYNEFLLRPFVEACTEVCSLGPEGERGTVLVVAQQLRSEDILEKWLAMTMRSFYVWRLPDEYCIDQLRSGSGYVVHLAVLRGDV